MSSALRVKNLKKVYPGRRGHTAVNDISFSLEKGEILGLLGPNGSGKTTTIQMLLGTLSSTSGDIFYFDMDFAKHRTAILQSVSFASTYTNLPGQLTIEENLQVFGRFYGFSPKMSQKRYEPLLERFGMLEKRKARVSTLSAGLLTRVMIIKAFFISPKVLLLDEPTASLDPDIAREICAFILEEREKTGVSILFTSHKMQEATELCDRAIFLKGGQIIADDIPKKLATSVSSFRLRLVVMEGMEKLLTITEQKGYSYKIDHHNFEITIEEKEVASFLTEVAEKRISYAEIKIEEPSLEDYFFHITRQDR